MQNENMNTLGGPSVIPMNTGEDELLTGDELCRKLKIKKSFLYAPVRRKGPDAVPCIMIGKYLRYNFLAVKRWIESQNQARG